MKTLAKLVHKTYTTYLHTGFPAHYYGMPNGSIYMVFSRFYKVASGETGLEFVFAVHKEFLYDYENEKLLSFKSAQEKVPVFDEVVDKPDPNIRIIKINRELYSYGEAFNFINERAIKMQKSA